MDEWSLTLDEQLLASVARRAVVLTIPKRLRSVFAVVVEVFPDPLRWAPRGGEMLIIAFVTKQAFVTRTLAYFEQRGWMRAGPGTMDGNRLAAGRREARMIRERSP